MLQYQIVKNTLKGDVRVEKGPKLLFLRPYDVLDGEKQTAISLRATQYVRLLDKKTGQVRVVKGELGNFVPEAYETFLDYGVCDAVSLKLSQYVKIENKETGEIRVERGAKLVFLAAQEQIIGSVEEAVDLGELE